MTQDRDRLDRIEASLDRQVAVNAELRATAEALLAVANVHQQNFERLSVELNADREEWRSQIDRIWDYLLRQTGNGHREI